MSEVPNAQSPSQRLYRLFNLPLSKCLLEYVVDLTIDAVHHTLPNHDDGTGQTRHAVSSRAQFIKFVDIVVYRAQVPVTMLIAAAVYITRSKTYMEIGNPRWAYERVFLGALIVALKFHNDNNLKSHQWSIATGVLFSPQDINRIEREMLGVLDFELRVEEHDFLAHEYPILLHLMAKASPRRVAWPVLLIREM